MYWQVNFPVLHTQIHMYISGLRQNLCVYKVEKYDYASWIYYLHEYYSGNDLNFRLLLTLDEYEPIL